MGSWTFFKPMHRKNLTVFSEGAGEVTKLFFLSVSEGMVLYHGSTDKVT